MEDPQNKPITLQDDTRKEEVPEEPLKVIKIPPTDEVDRLNRDNQKLIKRGYKGAGPKKRQHEIEFEKKKREGFYTDDDYRIEPMGRLETLPQRKIIPSKKKLRRPGNSQSPSGLSYQKSKMKKTSVSPKRNAPIPIDKLSGDKDQIGHEILSRVVSSSDDSNRGDKLSPFRWPELDVPERPPFKYA